MREARALLARVYIIDTVLENIEVELLRRSGVVPLLDVFLVLKLCSYGYFAIRIALLSVINGLAVAADIVCNHAFLE